MIALTFGNYVGINANLAEAASEKGSLAHFGDWLLGALAGGARLLIGVAVAMLVIRHAMLGAKARFRLIDLAYWKCVGAVTLLDLGVFGLAMSILVGQVVATDSTNVWLIVASVYGVGLFFSTRLGLTFTHIAIGHDADWFASWRDTRGHFWTIARLYLIASGPFDVLERILFTAGPNVHLHGIAVSPIVLAVARATCDYLNWALTAASCAWLYRRYARLLLELVQIPESSRVVAREM
ncbi:hypothetical protein [Trinickia fusca]|uniref:hypothetical protein n=1 Tax=Trinickia fusca TaxID=2419777 RepID=UPI0011C4209B|nr:hypothetical protein [Trinickia fusca]